MHNVSYLFSERHAFLDCWLACFAFQQLSHHMQKRLFPHRPVMQVHTEGLAPQEQEVETLVDAVSSS